MFRHAGLDLFLDPAVHRRGLGTETVRVLCTYLIDERGFHRLVIDPEVANEVAIACYRKVGFKPVGVMRRYQRDRFGEWKDGLLMDLLADELVRN
jgi:aminoglycoside 6'-N-acetyltransferase